MKPSLPNSASYVSSSQVHSGRSVATVSKSSTSTLSSIEVGLNPSVTYNPASTNKYFTPSVTVHTKRMAHKVSSINPGLNQKEAYSPISNSNYLIPPTNDPNKCIIRKITPIDSKKLQQTGLDRKIAEALSKQKSEPASSSKLLIPILNVKPTSSSIGSSPAATNPTNFQATPYPEGAKCLKSKNKAEVIHKSFDKSLKSHNIEYNSYKGKMSSRLRSEHMTDDDIPKSLHIPEKHYWPQNFKHKEKIANSTPTTEKHFNDTSTTSLVRSIKRSLSMDSYDDEDPLPTTKLIIKDSNGDFTSTPLKKTNENKSTTDDLKPKATLHSVMGKNETPMLTEGRKRKNNITESNFNSRLLLITRKEQLDSDEVITATEPGSGSIQCGFCLGRTTNWVSHLAEHYGVGWQVGQQKLNVGNRSVVLSCIISYMKSTSCEGLACRMCKKKYISGLGILMHIEKCSAQETRVICNNCKRYYSLSYLPIHIRSCYAKTAKTELEKNAEQNQTVFGNTGRVNRNSTVLAESKLKVVEAELEQIRNVRVFATEKEAIEHVIKSQIGGRRARKLSEDSDCFLKTDDEETSDDNCLSEPFVINEVDQEDSEEEEYDLEETPKTPTIEKNLNDTLTTSLVRSIKRSLSTKSSDDEDTLLTTKKRPSKRPPKRKLIIEDSDSDSTSTSFKKTNEYQSTTDDIKPIATPHLAVVNFNSRLLLITRREQLETDEVITETKPGSGLIQCGLCLGRTKNWTSHLAEHYGVGWQVGEEKLNVEKRAVVLTCIRNYFKSTGCKKLPCRMCKKEYISALGILAHIETCGAQVTRVMCEYCKKNYAPSSLPSHIRSCYFKTAFELNKSSELEQEKSAEQNEKVFGNTGRVKRNSTIKAESKLKMLGAELENTNNTNNYKSKIDPKSQIRYGPPLKQDPKWSNDIKKLGTATCPKNRCKFSSSDLKEFSKHLKNCKHIKSGYFCNFCHRLVFETEKEAIEHVIKNHIGGRRARKQSSDSDCILKTDDEETSDDNYLSEAFVKNKVYKEDSEEEEKEEDYVDEVSENRRKRNKKRYSKNVKQSTRQANRKEVFDGRFDDLNTKVLKKWKSFLKLNYSDEPLYAEFTAQYSVTNQQDFSKYLPKQNVSMKFNFNSKPTLTGSIGQPESNIEWSELKRYESIHNSKNTYFFLGAPIKLCCWLPLPAHINEQYLAVVYRQDMFKFIKFTQPTQHHSIILIFKVTQNNQSPMLNIFYGFVVPDGPVHHVAFLPSGGYDETSNRLCLVAVATVTSTIKVYSLPLDVKIKTTESSNSNDHITLIEVKPSFILNLDILDEQQTQQQVLFNTQCLQICWSEFSGHQHIFASFSNGFIGIWDINNDAEDNLNIFWIDDVANYAPLNYFYLGEKCVKCLALHYDTNGPRWLAASGAYRKFVILDIKAFTRPIVLKEEANRNILLSLDWCPVWETLLYSYCDSLQQNNGRCVMVVNPTNTVFAQTKMDAMLCGVTQVQYTPLVNMCVSALDNGDVVFLDTKELHYEQALCKKFGKRRMLYSMDVKNLNGKPLATLKKANDKNANTNLPSKWSIEDEDYREKYGLIFKPLLKLNEECKGPYLSERRCPPSNIIPLMRINSLCCNLNLNAKNLIALGYENGFLRLVYFNKDNL